MPKYLFEISYTAQGARGLLAQGGSARRAAIAAGIEQAGGKLEAFYFAFGGTDAYVIAEIDGKITQLLIEWKFTEGASRPIALNKFAGLRGIERVRRYSSILAEMRGPDFPFAFTEEGGLSIQDFSTDHLYQLLRMTLLARKTTPLDVGPLHIEDYRIAHLSHSDNPKINAIQPEYAKYCPGLQGLVGKDFHEVWATLLAPDERRKFIAGYWDHGISAIKNPELRDYLQARYA